MTLQWQAIKPLIGKKNSLTIVELEPRGAWLEAGEYGELLLPRRQLPAGAEAGQAIEVFLYLDADCEPVITTDQPKAMVAEVSLEKFGGATLVL